MPKTAEKGSEREDAAPGEGSSRFSVANKEPFLVTGGTGFLGVALIQLLISKGGSGRFVSSGLDLRFPDHAAVPLSRTPRARSRAEPRSGAGRAPRCVGECKI